MKTNRILAAALVATLVSFLPSAASAEPLRVFATTTDLADLVREVGGDRVSVLAMVKGRDDPHFAEARPSFIKELSQADLFVQVGLELEVGYVPLLTQNARNARVLPGASGFLDASRAIVPLDVPTSPVDRSMGDVHSAGSPHYLLDPVRGVEVAGLLAARLAELRPADADYFRARLADFRSRVAAAMVGEALAGKYDAFKLAQLAEKGGLDAFLRAQGDRETLGGWYAAMLPLAGSKVVDDHWMWTYFARRFGLVVVGHLEPKPGIPPSTSHLRDIVERMKAGNVKALIASPYYDPRHAEMVAAATGAKVIELAHQTGGRDGADTWLSMVDYNVRTTAKVLGEVR
ncbi:MAG: metal ABC transporter substrate-binding protein [Candidatus Binatia bacterium]